MYFSSNFRQKLLISLLSVAVLFGMFSCARDSGEPRIYTGKTITRQYILERHPVVNFGKLEYAEVNSEWLKWCFGKFQKKIGNGQYGVLRWDSKSQCTYFVTAFEEFAQSTYFAHAFHGNITAPGIAVGSFWYLPTSQSSEGHAVIAVLTENGRQFFEPQTGKFIVLTDAQIRSAYLSKFD